MKKVGIVLVCLQALAIFGAVQSGKIAEMLGQGSAGIFELIGFCLLGIIGVVLIIKSK